MQEGPIPTWFSMDRDLKNFARLAQLGIIFIIFGIIIALLMVGFGPRDHDDWGPSGDLVDWAEKGIYVGAITFYIGVLMLSLSFLTIALFSPNLHIHLRVGLLIAMGLVLGPALSMSFYGIGYWF